jgi:CheY-like chemotaxis protein
MGLEGLRVLLVEDESLVAMAVEDMLRNIGCEVAASACSVDEAFQKVAAGGFGFALLDVSLRGKKVFPVAEALSNRGIPFAFASGYGSAAFPEAFKSTPVVSKPFQLEDLSAALRAALAC